MTSSIIFMIFILFTISTAQDRAPHGIAYQTPMVISPEAYDFFHPDMQTQEGGAARLLPCHDSSYKCSNLPVAAATMQSTSPDAGGKKSRISVTAIATIAIGGLSVVMVAIGVYQLVIIRRNKAVDRARDANLVKLDV